MLTGEKKRYIAWGVIGVVLFSVWVNHIAKKRRIEAENAAQEEYVTNKVNPLLRKANKASIIDWPRGESPYCPETLQQELEGIAALAREARRQGESHSEQIGKLTAPELPESDLRRWRSLKKDLQRVNKDLEESARRAGQLYEGRTAEWLKLAKSESPVSSDEQQAESLQKALLKEAKHAEEMLDMVEENGEAYYGYEENAAKLKRYAKQLGQELGRQKEHAEKMAQQKALVIGDDGGINHASEPMQKIDALLNEITGAEAFPIPGEEPALYVAPPPPPFSPDLRIVATGDLSSTLLEPLVTQWLQTNKAEPVEGTTITWVDGDPSLTSTGQTNSREVEVKVPRALQGAEPGRLKIRITSAQQPNAVFSLLSNEGGEADLVLTGRRMTSQEERRWLPMGKSLTELDQEGHGRAYRTRVCADALLFFRGNMLDFTAINSESLGIHTKFFSSDSSALNEALAVFGITPTAMDVTAAAESESVETLAKQNPQAIILGTWHKDSRNRGAAMAVNSDPTLSYAVSLDSKSLRNADKTYISESKGCLPTEGSINSGRYAFSYNISFYRSTAAAQSAAARSLMAYAGNVEDKTLSDLIRRCGFVPVQTGAMQNQSKLTNEDLPIELLLRDLPADFGYVKGVSTWVYGRRLSIPIFYDVGSTKAQTMALDPDAIYYYSRSSVLDAIPRDKKACLVIVGHADPQWGGSLDTGRESWKGNLDLSKKRALNICNEMFKPALSGASSLRFITMGCSWARPACDISTDAAVFGQERALARCRRAEVFVVLPMETGD